MPKKYKPTSAQLTDEDIYRPPALSFSDIYIPTEKLLSSKHHCYYCKLRDGKSCRAQNRLIDSEVIKICVSAGQRELPVAYSYAPERHSRRYRRDDENPSLNYDVYK